MILYIALGYACVVGLSWGTLAGIDAAMCEADDCARATQASIILIAAVFPLLVLCIPAFFAARHFMRRDPELISKRLVRHRDP